MAFSTHLIGSNEILQAAIRDGVFDNDSLVDHFVDLHKCYVELAIKYRDQGLDLQKVIVERDLAVDESEDWAHKVSRIEIQLESNRAMVKNLEDKIDLLRRIGNYEAAGK